VRVAALALCSFLVAADVSPEPARVVTARARAGPRIARALETAGVPGPRTVLLRVFKEEGVLEVWVAEGRERPFVHLGDHPVCASSGGPGPKVRHGDGQVPEGVYRVTALNPWSQFHLSMRLDYPNAADRARNPGVEARELGGEIFIHGGCATIGCIPLGDEAIEEVYLLAQQTRAAGGEVSVLILPARPGAARWTAIVGRGTPGEVSLWRSLEVLSTRLDRTHRWPRIQAQPDGSYVAD